MLARSCKSGLNLYRLFKLINAALLKSVLLWGRVGTPAAPADKKFEGLLFSNLLR